MSDSNYISDDVMQAARVHNAAVVASLQSDKVRYIPHNPFGRQKLLLHDLKDEYEALYGGAAGGMKSDAILQAALEYVHIPHYAALILRRTYTDLSKPGALLDRAREWLSNTDATTSDGGKTWHFPSKATLAFGYMESEADKYQYQSAEYQFIAPDELTQFTESQYLYLFTRLRRPAIPCLRCMTPITKRNREWQHLNNVDCRELVPDPVSFARNAKLYDVPLRMRSASNPGGEGHEWVKERFIPEDYRGPDEERIWVKEGVDETGESYSVSFVPSRLEDNPFIDQDTYDKGLRRLDRVTYSQMRKGDWAISPTGKCYFDLVALTQFKAEQPAIGELLEVDDELGQPHLIFSQRPGGNLALWRRPARGRVYAIGADTASGKDANKGEGKASRDWSVCIVRDVETGEQMARYRGQVSERLFGEVWARLSRWYNDAFIVPAVTGGYGRAALNRAIDCGLRLELVYQPEDETGIPGRRKTGETDLGFSENNATRMPLYSALDLAIMEHLIETYDAVTINEYYSFETNKDGKPEARAGCKDDCVTADALCVKGIKTALKYYHIWHRKQAVQQRNQPTRYAESRREQLRRSV